MRKREIVMRSAQALLIVIFSPIIVPLRLCRQAKIVLYSPYIVVRRKLLRPRTMRTRSGKIRVISRRVRKKLWKPLGEGSLSLTGGCFQGRSSRTGEGSNLAAQIPSPVAIQLNDVRTITSRDETKPVHATARRWPTGDKIISVARRATCKLLRIGGEAIPRTPTPEKPSTLLQLPYPIRRQILQYATTNKIIQLSPEVSTHNTWPITKLRKRWAMYHAPYPQSWMGSHIRGLRDDHSMTFENECSASGQIPLGLLSLQSWRIRNKKYKRLHVGNQIRNTYLADQPFDSGKLGWMNLMLTCRQLYVEAQDLVYQYNTFSFYRAKDFRHLPRTISYFNFEMIRHVHILCAVWLKHRPAAADKIGDWRETCAILAYLPMLSSLDVELVVMKHDDHVGVGLRRWMDGLKEIRGLKEFSLIYKCSKPSVSWLHAMDGLGRVAHQVARAVALPRKAQTYVGRCRVRNLRELFLGVVR